MLDAQERGVGNCLVQFIFNLRNFHLASCARVIDIGAIDSHAYSTRSQTSRIVYSEWKVSPKGNFLQFVQISQVFSVSRVFFHKLHHRSHC